MATLIIPVFAFRFKGPFTGPYHLVKQPTGMFFHTACDEQIQQGDQIAMEIRQLKPSQLCDVCLRNCGMTAIESRKDT